MDVLETPLEASTRPCLPQWVSGGIGGAGGVLGQDMDLGLHGPGRLPADPSLAASAGLLAFLPRFSQPSNPFTDEEPWKLGLSDREERQCLPGVSVSQIFFNSWSYTLR